MSIAQSGIARIRLVRLAQLFSTVCQRGDFIVEVLFQSVPRCVSNTFWSLEVVLVDSRPFYRCGSKPAIVFCSDCPCLRLTTRDQCKTVEIHRKTTSYAPTVDNWIFWWYAFTITGRLILFAAKPSISLLKDHCGGHCQRGLSAQNFSPFNLGRTISKIRSLNIFSCYL